VNDPYCWGIFREEAHSPGRESDDAEILRLTAKGLEAKGFQVDLKTPDELGVVTDARPCGIFFMCEQRGRSRRSEPGRRRAFARSTARPPCSTPIATA